MDLFAWPLALQRQNLRIIWLFFMIFGFLHAECEKKILVSMVFGFECVEYEESVLVVQ